MEDPDPSRIAGRKVHTVEHQVRWDYVLLAVLGLVVVWKVAPVLAEVGQDDEDQEI